MWVTLAERGYFLLTNWVLSDSQIHFVHIRF